MNKIFRLLLVTLFCGVALSSCSDADEDAIPSVAVSDKLALSCGVLDCHRTTDEISVQLTWRNTEWKASVSDGRIIDEVSPTTGGSATGEGVTEISVKLLPNTTERVRTQSIIFTDDAGAECSVLIRQDTHLDEVEVLIDETTKYQDVVGFGAMHNPYIWSSSNVPSTQDIMTAYSPTNLGLTIQRLMIYADSENFYRDVEAAKAAQSNGAIIFASPWDCNGKWCDRVTDVASDGSESKVKHLKPEHYKDYALHLCNFVEYMKSQGVDIYAISIQNEPDGTFVRWTADEIVKFAAEYGDMIRQTGVKLMAPETMGIIGSYTDALFGNQLAWNNTDIVAEHLYSGFLNDNEWSQSRRDYIERFYNSQLLPAGKSWWMTEHLFNDGETETDTSKWLFSQWNYCLDHLGLEIYECLERGCSAYIYWYLKRFYGLLGDNSDKSPVATGEVTKNGYIMSQYSKAASATTRIEAYCNNKNVLVQAFQTESGNVNLVVLNRNDQNAMLKIALDVSSVTAFTSHESVNALDIDTIIEDGVIKVELPARSITTILTVK